MAELAREFGCTAQTIANWVTQAAIDRGKPLPGSWLPCGTYRSDSYVRTCDGAGAPETRVAIVGGFVYRGARSMG